MNPTHWHGMGWEARYEVYLKHWVGAVLLLPVCLYFALHPFLLWPGDYCVVHHADLIIHEAGHFFFRFFGRFMHIAGGTLMQILLPALLIWNFLRNDYRLGAQVSLLWLGHNLIGIGHYASDGQERQLRLIGNLGQEAHDWGNMLRMTGLTAYDDLIAAVFVGLGYLAFAALLYLPRRMM